ncbi:MAG TPA: FHA domain-containing protein [Actinomycetota bacterium]|nr:FHA domain-containing protein [Actinomycetota bacterium]
MSPFVLSILKYALLALVYLFIWRTLRIAARELRPPVPEAGAGAPRAPRPARSRAEARAPRSLVVRAADGTRLAARKLDGPVQIGRGPACDLRLEDAYVSNVHARIFPREGGWYVEDLGSTNGTFVNEERIAAPAPVRAGDRVRVGTTLIELRR